ncbi:hypothetical protein AAGS61_08515 [Lysinibacillus sp. KU-BSD001]|uniref:hypothetical protein n=1 Tax=Lysinibacillus sp. KU-BSD001 TaxID=3141328 RepID=UPI0036EEE733
MEKTVTIDNQKIRLKVTAGCVRMYKLQFRRDLIKDVFKMKKLEKYLVDGELIMSDEAIAAIDFEVFSDLLWVFAKKADSTIPGPMEWEDSFTAIPFREIYPEVIGMLTILLDGQKKQVAQAGVK